MDSTPQEDAATIWLAAYTAYLVEHEELDSEQSDDESRADVRIAAEEHAWRVVRAQLGWEEIGPDEEKSLIEVLQLACAVTIRSRLRAVTTDQELLIEEGDDAI